MEYRCPKCNYQIGEVVSHTTVKVNAPPIKKEKESPSQVLLVDMTDMKGKPCQCPGCNGHYDEIDLYCDWDGVVRCIVCKHTIVRYNEIPVKTTKKKDSLGDR